MIKIKLIAFALFVNFLIGSVALAQVDQPTVGANQFQILVSDSEELPLDAAVKTGTLKNGFRYFIRKNVEPQARATFYLAMKAGSILETEEELGLAHFLEHMAFNGTKNYPKNDLINYLQSNGVRFGADLNAYTSFDETVYQLPIPTDDPKIVENGIQILRDWAQDILLETEEIEKERGVIIEEKRLGKGAGERMQNQYLPVLFNHSRYANRLPIGKEDVLLNFEPGTIRDFYKKWYRPDLQALIVVGDIDVEEIEKLIIEKFSDMNNPSNAPEREEYTIPLEGKNQFISVTDKENPSTVIQVLMKHKAPELKTTADFRESLKKVLFNNLMASRISELRKQADPPFLQGGSSIGDFMAGLEVASVVAAVKPGELERGFKAVWTETERIKKFGFTQTELDRVKNAILVYRESVYKEREKTHSNSYVQEYLSLFLKDEASPGQEYEYQFYNNVLPGILLEEVNALASKYYTDINRDILVMAPEDQKDSLPTEATVIKWIEDVQSAELFAYQDTVSGKPLMAEEPVAGKIVKEQTKELGITELTLSNGAKVILKPTDFKNDEIRFASFSPGGHSLYTDEEYQSAVNATAVVASSGLGDFNSIELPKVLSGKMVSVSPYISERYEGINGSSSPADLETALKLVNLFFTKPRADEEIFKGLITNYKSSLLNRSNNPNSVFSDTASAVLSNYHVRRTGPSIEKANQISLPKAFEIYKDRFSDASDFTFFFVGNLKEDSIRPLLEKYIASLPSTKRVEEGRDLGIRIPEGRIRKVVYKGAEDKATVQLVISGDYKYGEKENLRMEALQEILKIRLTERLREDEGGVYSPNASVNYGKFPVPQYTVSISFGCAPENVDKLIAATLDEIDKLQFSGPKEEDLTKFKSETQRSRETGLKANGFWLSYLSGKYQRNEDIGQLNKFNKLLNGVKTKHVKDVAKKYLTTDNFVELILMPEALEGK